MGLFYALEIIMPINKYSQISGLFPQFFIFLFLFCGLSLFTTSFLYIPTADFVPPIW